MEKVAPRNRGGDLKNRTAPLRVAVGLLYRLMDDAKDERFVTVERSLFESLVTTLEIVNTDLSGGGNASAGREEGGGRKVVDGSQGRSSSRSS